MMKPRSIGVAIALMALARGAVAAGPLGHVVLAKRTVEMIRSGQMAAPPELKDALADPEVARAYYGGAIGPDLNESAHYGNTADVPARMLAQARLDLQSAIKSGDQRRLKTAREEIAFSYGWLNHCSADLNLHPAVNAKIGDTYRFNSAKDKALHGEYEAQFTAFLAHGKALPSYDPLVPVDFMARTTHQSAASLKAGARNLEVKARAEREWARIRGSSSANDTVFKAVETRAMEDNRRFLRDPSSMKNWDLDCGKISTDDFNSLHEAALKANGGKLPPTWGTMYLIWNDRTAGLPLDKKVAVLQAILLGAGAPPRQQAPKPNVPTEIPKGGAWVLQRTAFEVQPIDEMLRDRAQPQETGTDGNGTAQGRFGHPDPNIFVTVKISTTWTSPDRVLIPGKTYKLRFVVRDAGTGDIHGLFVGGNGSLGANCPAMSYVWYGPAAAIDLHANQKEADATKELTVPNGPVGAEMVITASYGVGIRAAYFHYVYKFVQRKG